jgi:hypothetical protein
VVALGAWATGAAVRVEPGGDVRVGHEAEPGADPDADPADLLIGTGLGGRPTLDPGEALTVVDVLAPPGGFVDDPGDEGAWASSGRTHATLLAEPAAPPGARLLLPAERTSPELLVVIAGTLPAGAGLVLARGFDAAGLRGLAEAEQADLI